MKKAMYLLSAAALTLGLVACGPTAPTPTTPDGTAVEGDKGVSGDVTGSAVGANTMVAIFGSFTNLSGNKIDVTNKTIDEDKTMVIAPVTDGKYSFALPKAPQKAQAALLKMFAFNDDNGNKAYDEGEMQSKVATLTWAPGVGYTGAQDADGNLIASISEFKDFDFQLGDDEPAESESSESAE